MSVFVRGLLFSGGITAFAAGITACGTACDEACDLDLVACSDAREEGFDATDCSDGWTACIGG